LTVLVCCEPEIKRRGYDGPQIVNRNADDLLSVAADKAFYRWITKYEF
jgi:hypothetical protein